MRDYQEFYQQLTRPLQERPILVKGINVLNSLITRMIYLIYPLFLVVLIWQGLMSDLAFWQLVAKVMPFLVIPAVSLIVLSKVRKVLNYPRPYEQWTIVILIPKDTEGCSMPSRHVFSATIIAMCVLKVYFGLGIVLLVMDLLLGLVRVLGGVHYPRDILVGFVVGILSGSLLWFF